MQRAKVYHVTDDFPQRFADSLVSEVKAEMGRQSVASSRALGRLIGANSQYMSSRLDGDNPRTGERVPLNAHDISAIARALGLTETELVKRAQASARRAHLRALDVPAPVDAVDDLPAVARAAEDEPGDDPA